MSQSDFLRKSLVDKIRYVFDHGIFVADTLFNQYKVNLVLVEGNCFEMFVNPASLDITSISPLDHTSIRMSRYNVQISSL